MPSTSAKSKKKFTPPTRITRPDSKGHNRPSVPTHPTVTLIGCGNWGSALALALHAAGVPIHEIIIREKSTGSRPSHSHARRIATAVGARITTRARAALDADVLWICTPDASIADVAKKMSQALRRIRRPNPPVVFHSSGALSSRELAPLQAAGAGVASVHPFMTFPKPSSPRGRSPHPTLAGIPFALEGDPRAVRVARQLVRALGGESFALPPDRKALYHAFGTFASPLVVALLTASVKAGMAAGFTPRLARRRMRPMVERTLQNFFSNGPRKSFSGPIARGDTATVARHMEALRPHSELLATYRALAEFAVASLPARNRTAMEDLLKHAF